MDVVYSIVELSLLICLLFTLTTVSPLTHESSCSFVALLPNLTRQSILDGAAFTTFKVVNTNIVIIKIILIIEVHIYQILLFLV